MSACRIMAVAVLAGACSGPGLPRNAPSREQFAQAAAAAQQRYRACAALARGDRRTVSDLPEGRIVESFDWDLDGCPEVVVESQGEMAVWSYELGRVVRYPPAETLTFDRVQDVDSDGRPDLIDTRRYSRPRPDCLDTNRLRIGGPDCVWHSVLDGTFSDADDVARAQLLRQCPRRPQQLLVGSAEALDPHQSLLNIACARFWGASAAETEQRVRAEWPAWQDQYHATSARGLPCVWGYDLFSQADIEPALALY